MSNACQPEVSVFLFNVSWRYQICVMSVFTLIETICPRICSKSQLNSAKMSLSVDVRCSKTSLLKLPFKFRLIWRQNGNVSDDGKARGKDLTWLPAPNLPLCHWSSQLFDLRAHSSTDVPVLLLSYPNKRFCYPAILQFLIAAIYLLLRTKSWKLHKLFKLTNPLNLWIKLSKRWRLLWINSYANEQTCDKCRQQRFAYISPLWAVTTR